MLSLAYSLKWLIDQVNQDRSIKFLYFWGHTNKHNEAVGKFCFSQWFEMPFSVDGVLYKTAEHWMMANKALLFEDFKSWKKIVNAHKPGEVKELGRNVLGFDEIVWRQNRYEIVVKGNIHKFNQHPTYAEYLLQTGDRILVEASPVDKIWGIGLSQDNEYADTPELWEGENLLGFALMEVRDFLKQYGHFDIVKAPTDLPWKLFPEKHTADMFWRMGTGEEICRAFWTFYSGLPVRDKIIFRLTNPEPFSWKQAYTA